MDNSIDKDNDVTTEDSLQAADSQLPCSNRRRFSRNAIAGSAVLLSLGNRAAWGQTTIGCMSVMTLDSFNPQTQMFASFAAAGRPGHDVDLASQIHDIAGPGTDYIGSNGNQSTCEAPFDPDMVCLVDAPSCAPQAPNPSGLNADKLKDQFDLL